MNFKEAPERRYFYLRPVLAAITLPSLTGNINERTWNTQRKALYARFSQAIALMPALNGYGTLSEDASGSVIEDTATETFMTAAFETQSGESILAFYNKSCTASAQTTRGDGVNYSLVFPEASACLNFIYDLNGNKGPNTVGKDIGVITVFNATDSNVVAPMPFSSADAKNGERMHWNIASSICTKENPDSRTPNVDELASMMINNKLINLSTEGCHWSGTTFATNTNKAWHICSIDGRSGYLSTGSKNDSNLYKVRCIRR